MKSYSIVYSSKTGNTKMLADTIMKSLPELECVYFGLPDEKALLADRIYVGFWTDKGNCDDSTAQFLQQTTSQEIFLFGTAGFGENPEYFEKILHHTEKHMPKTITLIGTYMCQGKMPMSVRERYEKMASSPIHMPNIKGMIENFDKALSHPDETDLQLLQEKIALLQ